MVIEPVINLKRHEFCPNQAFMDEVINILDTHLFCNEAERLRKAYEWMASRLNEPNVSARLVRLSVRCRCEADDC